MGTRPPLCARPARARSKSWKTIGSACRSAFRLESGLGLFMKGDELVIEIGTLRRHIGLPTSMAALEPSRARLENGKLVVELRER